MSYLNGPRINFWGGGSTNVDTANNEQYSEDGSTPMINLLDASVTSSMSDEAIIERLRSPATDKHGNNYFAKGGWNYYGDHQVALMNAKVSSSGLPGAIAANSELAGLPIYLLGSVDPSTGDGPYGGPVMVDLDPTSSTTTQIYAGGLLIGSESEPTLLVRGDSVAHSRLLGSRYTPANAPPPYLTPGSVWGSAIFQFAFPKSAIVSYDVDNDLLRAMIEDPDSQGIMLRFSMFQFFPGVSTDELQQNYAKNQNDPNPSLGHIVGSVGPWYRDELASDPPGRLLKNESLGAFGVALLDEEAGCLSLDLVSALEGSAIRTDGKANAQPPSPNIDYGDLIVYAGVEPVGSLPSNPKGYYTEGGLYDVSLSPEAVSRLKKAPISIRSTLNDLIIDEQPLRISSDQRNLYCGPETRTLDIQLRVEELGQPISEQIELNLKTDRSGELPDGGFLSFPETVRVAPGSREVSVQVTTDARKDGFSTLIVTVNGRKARCEINVRKYPHHDYSELIRSGTIPWDTVYEECLRFFYVLFPAMSKRIPLNDEATIRAVGTELLKRLSDPYRNTTLYMPLTRALSPGKIALLEAFLKQPR